MDFICTLANSGIVSCKGSGRDGITDVPLSKVFKSHSISAGLRHSCMINSNNNLVCWGLNTDKQCSVPFESEMFKQKMQDYKNK
jgi:alpha-tubulin suppressor-like RCC1 family protein